jgi:DNA recombination-mediator protein A
LAKASTKPASAPKASARLSHRQRLAWLRLIRSENVGPATFRALVNEFGGAEAAIDALPALSRRGGRINDICLCSEEDAEAELAVAESLGASLVAIGEPGYPPALAQVDAPPPLLYVKGRLDLADIPKEPATALPLGRNSPAHLRPISGMKGFVIASGLARGIDTAAHLAALPRGTIAVLAGGIDNAYPPENEELHRSIGEQGLLIRASARLRAAREGLPPPQSPDLGDLAWRGSGRGGRALGLTDHSALGRRARPRGVCRARQPARSTLGRNQQSPEAGRVPCDISARHRRDVGANPRQAASSCRCRARLRG